MKKYNLDALLLFASPSVRYVTDFFVKGYRAYSQDQEYLVVLPLEGAPILGYSSGSDEYRVKIRCRVDDSRKLPSHGKWPEAIAQILGDYGLGDARIGVDMLYYDTYLSLKKLLPGIEIENASKIWTDITAIKHPLEIECIKKATDITIEGVRAAIDAINDGTREIEVEAAAEYALRMAGTEAQFGIIQVASGKNSASVERIATNKKIRNGEINNGCCLSICK
jgi:Xaa-Pro aminopeptidase